ncbi:MAG: hypothetical protein R3D26_02945 [Cyanobacteriota/Melainabacteria group bacterium]
MRYSVPTSIVLRHSVGVLLTFTVALGSAGLLASGPAAYAQSEVGSDGYDSSIDGVDTSSSEPAMQETDPDSAAGSDPEAGSGLKTASSRTLLQGKTEKLDIILEDNKLYQVAMKAIAHQRLCRRHQIFADDGSPARQVWA